MKILYKNIIDNKGRKEALRYIKVTKDTMEATDNFRYVSVKNVDNIKEGFYLKNGEYKKDITYPDVSIIKKNAELKNTHIIKINRKYLIQALTALDRSEKKEDPWDSINLYIDTNNTTAPVYITNTNGFAFVMPLNQ